MRRGVGVREESFKQWNATQARTWRTIQRMLDSQRSISWTPENTSCWCQGCRYSWKVTDEQYESKCFFCSCILSAVWMLFRGMWPQVYSVLIENTPTPISDSQIIPVYDERTTACKELGRKSEWTKSSPQEYYLLDRADALRAWSSLTQRWHSCTSKTRS